MTTQPVITFRGIAGSRALESDILARINKLDACCGRIVSCHVVVELRERRHESGNRFHVRIRVVVPRGEIVTAHNGRLYAAVRNVGLERRRKSTESDPELKRAYVAVRQAFDAARRQLQDFTRRRRAKTTTVARKGARRLVAATELP